LQGTQGPDTNANLAKEQKIPTHNLPTLTDGTLPNYFSSVSTQFMYQFDDTKYF
jgi:hypothetical protein